MSQQTNMGQAAELGGWELVGGGWENGQAYLQRLRAVTPAVVQRVAQAYIKNARFVVLGDPAKVDRKLFLTL
jgi:predicted Zn-dependent peptidase